MMRRIYVYANCIYSLNVKERACLSMSMVKAERTRVGTEYPRETLSLVVRKIDEVKELVPTRLPDGGYAYKSLDDLAINVDRRELLEYMAETGYLEKKPAETMLVCPTCHKVDIVPILKCRSCSSLTVKRERLIEHKAGGHIHPESAFNRKDDKIICPSCGRALGIDEWRTIGAWFVCSECGERQGTIAAEFRCLQEGTTFSPIMGEFIMLYKYSLAEKSKTLIGFDRSTIVAAVVQTLSEKGKVETNFTVKGKSGVVHTFDISCTIGDKRIIIDVAFSSQPVDDPSILSIFAKTFEVKDEYFLLIAWPSLSKSAQELSNFYKINVIQAAELSYLQNKLNEFVAEHFK